MHTSPASAVESRARPSILSGPPRDAAASPNTARVSSASLLRPKQGTTWRAAIVGAGYIADFHVPIAAAQTDVEVVAIVDADPSRAESIAKRYGVARVAASLEELAAL